MRGVTLAKQATRVPSPWDSSSFVQLKPWSWQSRENPRESPHLCGFPHPQWKVVFNLPEYLLILFACKKRKKVLCSSSLTKMHWWTVTKFFSLAAGKELSALCDQRGEEQWELTALSRPTLTRTSALPLIIERCPDFKLLSNIRRCPQGFKVVISKGPLGN